MIKTLILPGILSVVTNSLSHQHLINFLQRYKHGASHRESSLVVHRLLVLVEGEGRPHPDLTPVTSRRPSLPHALRTSLPPSSHASLPSRIYYFLYYSCRSVLSTMSDYYYVYIIVVIIVMYIFFVTTEFLFRPSSVPKSQVLLAKPRHLCDNRDPINQGQACFLSCLLKIMYEYISHYCQSRIFHYFLIV